MLRLRERYRIIIVFKRWFLISSLFVFVCLSSKKSLSRALVAITFYFLSHKSVPFLQ